MIFKCDLDLESAKSSRKLCIKLVVTKSFFKAGTEDPEHVLSDVSLHSLQNTGSPVSLMKRIDLIDYTSFLGA